MGRNKNKKLKRRNLVKPISSNHFIQKQNLFHEEFQ